MNKRKLIKVSLLLSAILSSCGGNNKSESSQEQSSVIESSQKNEDREFENVRFNDLTVTYNCEQHKLGEVESCPEGTMITYSDSNSHVDAGIYPCTATLIKEGYKTLELTATLTINKATFEGFSLENENISYDGNDHIGDISLVGTTPDGTTTSTVIKNSKGQIVTEAIDADTYSYTCTLENKNYYTKTLNATLTISKIDFVSITFKDVEVEYDGNPHSIIITGSLPSTATVTYSSNVDGITNTATEAGTYVVTATIEDKNFNTLTLTANLVIKVVEDERFLTWSDDTLFFQNALHNNYLYAFNDGDQNLVKVSNDNAVDIVGTNNDEVMFVSKSLISSSVKTATYDASKKNVSLTNILTVNARYVQQSGQHIYYVINGLTNAKSGIYKADLSGEDAIITCLSEGKAKFLTLVGNYLYFSDTANSGKFSRISVSGENQTREVVVDEKINNLIYSNGEFFYTVNKTLGDYIEKYSASNGRRKLTSDAGIDLCVIGNELYYINVDKLNTSIYGKGIYKVNKNPLADNNYSGTKIIENNVGVCSLISDGTSLYYYDMDGYKLVKANKSGEYISNLLEGFVQPEDQAPLSKGGDLEVYNGVLYYTDIWDEKTLHSYNPVTGANIRLTSNKIDNFSIVGDVIYLNGVTKLINNDTYLYNLKTGGELVLLNKYDGSEFVSDGTYVYYVEANAAGIATNIRKTNILTQVDEVIYTRGASNLKLINGLLYFIDNDKIYSYNPTSSEVIELKNNGKSFDTDTFDSDGINIYYREKYGVGKKALARYNLETGSYLRIVEANTDPITIVYNNGYVYYYSDTTLSASKNGLYKVEANTSSLVEGTSVLLTNSAYYSTNFTFIGSDIYFINYKTGGLFGDSHIYKIDGNTKEVSKVA